MAGRMVVYEPSTIFEAKDGAYVGKKTVALARIRGSHFFMSHGNHRKHGKVSKGDWLWLLL